MMYVAAKPKTLTVETTSGELLDDQGNIIQPQISQVTIIWP